MTQVYEVQKYTYTYIHQNQLSCVGFDYETLIILKMHSTALGNIGYRYTHKTALML